MTGKDDKAPLTMALESMHVFLCKMERGSKMVTERSENMIPEDECVYDADYLDEGRSRKRTQAGEAVPAPRGII